MLFQKLVILLATFLILVPAGAQTLKEVRKDKDNCEKNISRYNRLLNEKTKSRNLSVGRLSVLHQKIAESRRLLEHLEKERLILQNDIRLNEERIAALGEDRENTLELYRQLVYAAWKKKEGMNSLVFILSASDFNQAYKRFRYFQQLQQYSRRQLGKIRRLNDSLERRSLELKGLFAEKEQVLDHITRRSRELETEKLEENSYISRLKKEEKNLRIQLDKEKKRRKNLAAQLNRLVARQIKKSGSSSSTYRPTAADKLLSDDFVKNRGRLPWPVEEGTVVRKFGVYNDPLYRKVKVNSDGIDIMCLRNSSVRAVFKGRVADIGYDPYLNNMVVVSHGGYFTFYCNLVELKVKPGDTVKTGDVLGKVGEHPDGGSVLIFQVWKDFDKLNPELWLHKR